jgi:hypothetical protein
MQDVHADEVAHLQFELQFTYVWHCPWTYPVRGPARVKAGGHAGKQSSGLLIRGLERP